MNQLVHSLKALEAKLEVEKKKYEIVLNEGKRYEGEANNLKQQLADKSAEKREVEKEAEDLRETEFRLRNQVHLSTLLWVHNFLGFSFLRNRFYDKFG